MNVLLLADPSPSLKLRALTELEGLPQDDPEAQELRADVATSAEVERLLQSRPHTTQSLGYWLCRLAYLRYDGPEIDDAAAQLFERQQDDGSWPLWADEPPAKRRGKQPRMRPRSEGWQMIPVQTSVPLRGLAAGGYATDPRAEAAYEWLLAQRLPDGAWPGDVKADLSVSGPPLRVPGYRALPRSAGCRSATTGALAAFALHPERRTSAEARAALDHLLARETRDEWSLGFELSRLLGLERVSGSARLTFYATFDLAFLLDIATRCGVSRDDPRVADLVAFLEDLRGPYGLWEHHAHPQLSRWLTLDLDTSLRRLSSGEGDWTGSEVRVKFTAYPKRRRRY